MKLYLIKIAVIFGLLSFVACGSSSVELGELTGTPGGASGSSGGSGGDTGTPSGVLGASLPSIIQNNAGSRFSNSSQFKNFGALSSQGSVSRGSVYTSHSTMMPLSVARTKNGGSQP
ncbi:MAG: hypothetical protein IPJ69_11120 [Deltaproteobacteria bacterium]|nr:MAG: hypothetical protein IPJ69_11120 [Deltaproteobacteria bacterium]